MQRSILLRAVDHYWMDHIDAMDDLKGSVGLQAYAQRDPVTEYRIQGSAMFEEMVAGIRSQTVRNVLCAVPRANVAQRVRVATPLRENLSDGSVAKKTIVLRKAETIGRNDLCSCGSGKKYKHCCGAKTQK